MRGCRAATAGFGTLVPSCPIQAFEATDGWVLIGVTNDGAWRRFCEAAGFEEMGANPDYATARGRIEHRDEVVAENPGVRGDPGPRTN